MPWHWSIESANFGKTISGKETNPGNAIQTDQKLCRLDGPIAPRRSSVLRLSVGRGHHSSSATDEIPPIILAVNKTDLQERIVLMIAQIKENYGQHFAAMSFVSALAAILTDKLFRDAATVG